MSSSSSSSSKRLRLLTWPKGTSYIRSSGFINMVVGGEGVDALVACGNPPANTLQCGSMSVSVLKSGGVQINGKKVSFVDKCADLTIKDTRIYIDGVEYGWDAKRVYTESEKAAQTARAATTVVDTTAKKDKTATAAAAAVDVPSPEEEDEKDSQQLLREKLFSGEKLTANEMDYQRICLKMKAECGALCAKAANKLLQMRASNKEKDAEINRLERRIKFLEANQNQWEKRRIPKEDRDRDYHSAEPKTRGERAVDALQSSSSSSSSSASAKKPTTLVMKSRDSAEKKKAVQDAASAALGRGEEVVVEYRAADMDPEDGE